MNIEGLGTLCPPALKGFHSASLAVWPGLHTSVVPSFTLEFATHSCSTAFPVPCLCKELLSDTPIEDSVIMVQKRVATQLQDMIELLDGFCWNGLASFNRIIIITSASPRGIEIRGDLALTEKLDALPPKKKRMRNVAKIMGEHTLSHFQFSRMSRAHWPWLLATSRPMVPYLQELRQMLVSGKSWQILMLRTPLNLNA